MTAENLAERRRPPEAVRERYGALRAEIRAQGAGAAPDRYMKAFYQRCGTEFDTNPEFEETVWEYLELNPDDTPTYSANKLFRSVQYEVIPKAKPDFPDMGEHDHRDADYPRGRHKPEAWDDAFLGIQSPFGRYLFRQHLKREKIQSNVAPRGNVLKVAAQLFGLMSVQIYSGGCSMGHVEKLMALYDNNIFKYPSVAVGAYQPDRLAPYDFRRSDTQTRKYGALLRDREFQVRSGVLVDIGTPEFTAILDWARSCTFRPGEFLRKSNRDLVQRLIETDVPSLKFQSGDITLPDHVMHLREKFPRWSKDRFNMAIFSTSLYQCDEPGREQAFQNALEVTSDDGIIAVLDFAHRDSEDRHKLNFVPNWRDWDYNLHVYDKTNEDAGWQHVFRIREGRAREIVPGKDLTRIAFGAMREGA